MQSELLLSRIQGVTWAALREGGVTVELQVERPGEIGVVGDLFLGRVTRVVPGIQSAFVDVGLERDVFLHVRDLILPGEAPQAPAPPIQDRLREGCLLLVQIVRDGSGSKGARVTCSVSLPGRYLVHLPLVPERKVSRRIADPGERARLQELVERLPGSGGFVVRTAGRGAEPAALHADAELLAAGWREIAGRAAEARAPQFLHGDADLLLRSLRDASRESSELILVDDPDCRERAVAYLSVLDPVLAARVRLHTGPAPLFESRGVDRDLERALRPRVWLRSGSFLVVQETEAFVAVDVNSGKFLGDVEPEETALATNLEAAPEIARQLRLRDLGGIVVVDFIDMERDESRSSVLAAFGAELERDRARTRLLGFSELGVVLCTRRRTRRGLLHSLTRECPTCCGLGRVREREREP